MPIRGSSTSRRSAFGICGNSGNGAASETGDENYCIYNIKCFGEGVSIFVVMILYGDRV